MMISMGLISLDIWAKIFIQSIGTKDIIFTTWSKTALEKKQSIF